MSRFALIVVVLLARMHSYGQWDLTISSKVEKEGKGLGGAKIELIQGTKVVSEMTSASNGEFKVEVPPNGEFIIQVSYPNCNTKKFQVFTRGVPPDVAADDFKPKYKIGGFTMKEPLPGIDYSALKNPMVKIVYFPEIGKFDHVDDHTGAMLTALDKIRAAEQDLIDRQEQAVKDGDEALKKNDCVLAKSNYEKAIKLIPQKPYDDLPKAQILKCDKCIADKDEGGKKAAETAAAAAAAQKLAQEKAAAEKLAAEKAAADKMLAEKAAAEKKAADDLAKAQQEKAAKELAEKTKAESERLAKEKATADKLTKEKAEADKKAAEEQAKVQQEKLAKEKSESERLAKEKEAADKLAKEKAEADKKAAEESTKSQQEKLVKEKAEADRLAAEKAAADKLAKEKAEADKKAAAELSKQEQEKLAKENATKAKAESDRLAKEKEVTDRAAKEKAEADRLQAEQEKLAKEKITVPPPPKPDNSNAEAARLAKEKEAADKLAKEKAAADEKKLKDQKKAESERLAKEKVEQDARKKAEAEKLAKETVAKEKPKEIAKEQKPVAEEKVYVNPKKESDPTNNAVIIPKDQSPGSTKTKEIGSSKAKMGIPIVLGADNYKLSIKKADDYYKMKRYDEAKIAYEEALSYKANDAYAKSRLELIANINQAKK
ncbi:MAG: hypothetical protein PSX36_03015 [bacterium]|nr:hypothetical protein [bacterium]